MAEFVVVVSIDADVIEMRRAVRRTNLLPLLVVAVRAEMGNLLIAAVSASE